MRITLIQDNIVWADKMANLKQLANHLVTLSGKTDLVVLPEMFTTGFCVDNLELAEPMDGNTMTTLKALALEHQLAITGSFVAIENDKYFNRAFFVYPDRRVEYADKRHLFTHGNEDHFFTAGSRKLLVNYCGFNICVLVCYDLRFPVWSRNIDNEYDLLIYVANFPEKRIRDWDIMLKSRAIENTAYVCAVNRVGVDDLGIAYNGHSMLLDAKANEMLAFLDNESSIQTKEIHVDNLHNFRARFAVWKDADRFQIL
jgi:predicted amidohydrolase